jgi:alkylation response protein AidB-like acyl-CoA dehydrogenase
VYPTNAEGDKAACSFDPANKKVTVPEIFREPMKAFYEAGFIGIADDTALGGMGMPSSLGLACTEYFTAANTSLMMYPGLSHGAMNLIKDFASDELKHIYYPKMLSGEWGGTMCLTEADAGSDVGNLKSKAVKQADGTYLITGQNIFISSGDNDLYKNIIHLKLARVEGDPAGTAGISLFIVPKFIVKPDGSLGHFNDVNCAGIEHKMGIRGSATCTMSFGDEGKCIGYLVGKQRQGMNIMFHMMNEERAMVGCQSLGVASSAYMHAITYAKNRVQGKSPLETLDPNAKSIEIINHPDVKRMLLYMKSYVEAMRAIILFGGHIRDLETYGTGEEKEDAKRLSEFLRPILKAGNSDAAFRVASEAVQTYGGYGFCSDYPVEQMIRDAKILAIYEGTNGIQSMDFTLRKLVLDANQKNYNTVKKLMTKDLEKAKGVVDAKYLDIFERGIKKFDESIEFIKGQMMTGKLLQIFMEATPLQQSYTLLVYAWQHVRMLTVSQPKWNKIAGGKTGADLNKLIEDSPDAAFYCGKVLSSQFFISSEFPKMFGQLETIMIADEAPLNAHNLVFTGALDE